MDKDLLTGREASIDAASNRLPKTEAQINTIKINHLQIDAFCDE
ncbi:hypothetical protein [Herminiimonas sp. KBW02]|nr:hypothetical protein [Herminiimonas sp. KBW02]